MAAFYLKHVHPRQTRQAAYYNRVVTRIAPLVLLAALAQSLEAQGLAIQSASLQTQEDGPAAEAGRLFRAGELAYGSFFAGGYQRKLATDGSADSTISLSWSVDAVDANGLAIQERQEGKMADTVRKEDVREGSTWRPKFRFNLLMPPAAPSGTYKILMTLRDELSGKETKGEIPFEVKGYDPPKVDKLTVANLRFQRTDKQSERPLYDPVYRANEEVWVLFDAAGFQLADKNRYDVAYGLAILDAAGKVLFEQDTAAELTESPSYPKRGLPGALSIRVQPGTSKATYQFRVRVIDRIANQTAEQAGAFRVE